MNHEPGVFTECGQCQCSNLGEMFIEWRADSGFCESSQCRAKQLLFLLPGKEVTRVPETGRVSARASQACGTGKHLPWCGASAESGGGGRWAGRVRSGGPGPGGPRSDCSPGAWPGRHAKACCPPQGAASLVSRGPREGSGSVGRCRFSDVPTSSGRSQQDHFKFPVINKEICSSEV